MHWPGTCSGGVPQIGQIRGIHGFGVFRYIHGFSYIHGISLNRSIRYIHGLDRSGSYISPARVRPYVVSCARIMRARGRARAPARGDTTLICSRIRYYFEWPVWIHTGDTEISVSPVRISVSPVRISVSPVSGVYPQGSSIDVALLTIHVAAGPSFS